jgi:hypothetical protein
VIDHQRFIVLVNAEFPDALARIDRSGRGLLHVEMGLFRQGTEEAMDAGKFWLAEKHFRSIERVWGEADPELANAIEVSYLEDLALGECTPQRYRAVKERMPEALRKVLLSHHSNWK